MAIVKMRRLYLLTLRQEQDRLLEVLMQLGCVELRPFQEAEEALQLPLSAERSALQQVRGEQQALAQAMEHLKQCGVRFPLLQKRRAVKASVLQDQGRLRKMLSGAAEINRYGREMEAERREIARLQEQAAAMEPWLACAVPLDFETAAPVQLLFGTLPAKAETEALTKLLEREAPQSAFFLISRTRQRCCVAVLLHRDCRQAAEQALQAYGFRMASFSGLRGTAAEVKAAAEREIAALEEKIARRKEQIAAFASRRQELELALDQVGRKLLLEEAREQGGGDGTLVVLCGWIPAPQEAQLAQALSGLACAFQTRPPVSGEVPPTLLKNPKWMEPINVVTEMYSLPAYGGIDPNPLIFWFYLFFFGFMFADVAYGLILLAVSWAVIRLWDPRGAVGQLMHLGIYLGISTCLCGFLTGGFFGNAIEVIAATFFAVPFEALPLWLQRFSSGIVFNPLTAPMAVLYTTLIIGVIQLLFGQLVHIYMKARDGHPLDGLLDTVPWWLFFAGIALWIFDGGAALLLLGTAALIATQGRKKRGVLAKLAGGAASLYNVTNWLSDVLSYSRLMALMLATSVIATVINTLGALPGSWIAFVPVFLIGHLFNIAVNLIGTYVHAARLQYLEFYGKFYREGGVPFRPLACRTSYTDIIKEE